MRQLRAQNARRGHAIHPEACVPVWAGERLDLELGVDALLTWAPATTEPPGV